MLNTQKRLYSSEANEQNVNRFLPDVSVSQLFKSFRSILPIYFDIDDVQKQVTIGYMKDLLQISSEYQDFTQSVSPYSETTGAEFDQFELKADLETVREWPDEVSFEDYTYNEDADIYQLPSLSSSTYKTIQLYAPENCYIAVEKAENSNAPYPYYHVRYPLESERLYKFGGNDKQTIQSDIPIASQDEIYMGDAIDATCHNGSEVGVLHDGMLLIKYNYYRELEPFEKIDILEDESGKYPLKTFYVAHSDTVEEDGQEVKRVVLRRGSTEADQYYSGYAEIKVISRDKTHFKMLQCESEAGFAFCQEKWRQFEGNNRKCWIGTNTEYIFEYSEDERRTNIDESEIEEIWSLRYAYQGGMYERFFKPVLEWLSKARQEDRTTNLNFHQIQNFKALQQVEINGNRYLSRSFECELTEKGQVREQEIKLRKL